jgi:Fur family transcriptional regulator, iron response regulator
LHVSSDSVRFDPNTARHHHVVDDDTGYIYDIPWTAIRVSGATRLPGFDVRDYQVIAHGRRAEADADASSPGEGPDER